MRRPPPPKHFPIAPFGEKINAILGQSHLLFGQNIYKIFVQTDISPPPPPPQKKKKKKKKKNETGSVAFINSGKH